MKHKLMDLPYALNALEPYMSKETLEFHYGKHHQTYVNKLNELSLGSKYEDMNIKEIILHADGAILNNAAQIYNHDFFWNSISDKHTIASDKVESLIIKSFGSKVELKKEFLHKAVSHFGSGWIWLVLKDDGLLDIITTSNALTAIEYGVKPIFTCDVWEHAYYIDHRNKRLDYLNNFLNLLNWEFINKNIE